ncbi:MAG: hypothetical protein LAQ30_19530 [Acidobacteriia bacterium]|nr:hypothetical protein [Terriglobia bacterium]
MWKLLRGERGQDLVEYTLMMAFLALACGGLFLASGGSVKKIWQGADSTVASAAVTAGAASPLDSAVPPVPPGDGDGHHDWR